MRWLDRTATYRGQLNMRADLGGKRLSVHSVRAATHYISCLFAFAPDGIIPECVPDALGPLCDCTVSNIRGLKILLADVYDHNGGKEGMGCAFAIADFDLSKNQNMT